MDCLHIEVKISLCVHACVRVCLGEGRGVSAGAVLQLTLAGADKHQLLLSVPVTVIKLPLAWAPLLPSTSLPSRRAPGLSFITRKGAVKDSQLK